MAGNTKPKQARPSDPLPLNPYEAMLALRLEVLRLHPERMHSPRTKALLERVEQITQHVEAGKVFDPAALERIARHRERVENERRRTPVGTYTGPAVLG